MGAPSLDKCQAPTLSLPSVSLSLDSPPRRGAKNDPRTIRPRALPLRPRPAVPRRGGPCGYGFVDLCHNNQTAIDLMRSAIIKNTVVGATPRYFQRIDGASTRRSSPTSAAPSSTSAATSARTACARSASAPQRRVHGRAELQHPGAARDQRQHRDLYRQHQLRCHRRQRHRRPLQEASGKGGRDSTRGSYVAYAQIVELCIELIRQFYGLPRSFRIAGRAGAEEYIRFSNAGLCPRPRPSEPRRWCST